MGVADGPVPGINLFSLVAYLPDPLAGFVDTLRRDVQPGSTERGHVTLLPPRPLSASIEQACTEIAAVMENEPVFEVHLSQVCVFPASGVVHLAIGHGSATLIRLHRTLNRGACDHLETFYYHPHVTAAQGLPPEAVTKATEAAVARWRAYEGPRTFAVEKVTLVQNTGGNEWRNLKEFALHTPLITVRE